MRVIGVFLIIGFIIAGTSVSAFAQAESLTITTYYPSPYGSFNELQANLLHMNPRICDASECDESAEEGRKCYDQLDHEEKVCIPNVSGGYEWTGAQGQVITASVNVPAIVTEIAGSGETEVTVVGARENDVVTLGPPDNWRGAPSNCCCGFSGHVSSDDRVTIVFGACCSGNPCTVNAGTWKVRLSK